MPAKTVNYTQLLNDVEERMRKLPKGSRERDALADKWKQLHKEQVQATNEANRKAAASDRALQAEREKNRQARDDLARSKKELAANYGNTAEGSGQGRGPTPRGAREEALRRGDIKPGQKPKPGGPNVGGNRIKDLAKKGADAVADAAKRVEDAKRGGLEALKNIDAKVKTKTVQQLSKTNFGRKMLPGLKAAANYTGPLLKKGRQITGSVNRFAGPIGLGFDVWQVVGEQNQNKEIKDTATAINAVVAQNNKIMQAVAYMAESQSQLAEAISQMAMGLGEMAQSIQFIEEYTSSTDGRVRQVNFSAISQNAAASYQSSKEVRDKLAQVNFAAIKNDAKAAAQHGAWTQTKLSQVNFAAIKQGVERVEAALPKNQIFRVDQTGIANRVKEILDPSFKAIDGKLPKNEIFRVDQTGIAKRVKELLDPSFKTIDGKLPTNGIFRIDNTAVANRVKGVLDPTLYRIETKIVQPNLGGVLSQLTRIEGKIPPPIPADLVRKGDLRNISINFPPDLATKSDIANIRIPQVNFPPDLATKSDIANIRIPQVNFPPDLATKSDLNNITVNIPADVARKTDITKATDPIAINLNDVSKVLGVSDLKNGLSIKPNEDLTKIGQTTDGGINRTIAQNIPQLLTILAAVPYVRGGLHRLGGSYDRSVMQPGLGKTKITDALGFHAWQFSQIDERLGLPTPHTIKGANGQAQAKSFRNIQDTVEEVNSIAIANGQDLEVVERYLFALTQDLQKLMQIALQTREDVDLLIDDSGAKFKEIKRSHPTHIKLGAPGKSSSLETLFSRGEVHYVAKKWDDAADKRQILERISYDTQIAAMSNKFPLKKGESPELPLDKSRANSKTQSDDLWRTFVSTMTEPPEGYTTPGNPIPKIEIIENGTAKPIPKPTKPNQKLGK